MPPQTSRPFAESRARARAMWRAGYSVRYIASALGIGARAAAKQIGVVEGTPGFGSNAVYRLDIRVTDLPHPARAVAHRGAGLLCEL